MSIYVWKLGDVALARLCQKVYAKVRVVKNDRGLFHDEKGLILLFLFHKFFLLMQCLLWLDD